MILPIKLNDFSNKLKYSPINSQKNNAANGNDRQNNIKLSGFNNPMKSYISFGWCTAHYQAMYEIDEKFSQKINTKLKQIENLKNTHEERKKRYSIVDNAALEAGRILAQYANMQCVIAEVPPSYAVITGGKLKQAMAESTTLSNPVSCLITINAISNMQAKNNSLDEKHLERGKGATQLYSIAILLNQIEKNKNKPEYLQNADSINMLVQMVKKSLSQIYGEDILERLKEFANMGKNPTTEQKTLALDFLVEMDSIAQNLTLPDDFQEKLSKLLDEQSASEGRILPPSNELKNTISIKIQYPDHDHSVAHAHGIPHSHEHHEHQHTSRYETILENSRSSKNDTKTTPVVLAEEKNKQIIGE